MKVLEVHKGGSLVLDTYGDKHIIITSEREEFEKQAQIYPCDLVILATKLESLPLKATSDDEYMVDYLSRIVNNPLNECRVLRLVTEAIMEIGNYDYIYSFGGEEKI